MPISLTANSPSPLFLSPDLAGRDPASLEFSGKQSMLRRTSFNKRSGIRGLSYLLEDMLRSSFAFFSLIFGCVFDQGRQTTQQYKNGVMKKDLANKFVLVGFSCQLDKT